MAEQSDVDLAMMRGLLFTQTFMIRALIDTHPNAAALQAPFLRYVNSFVEGLNDQPPSKMVTGAVRLHADEFLGYLP